MSDPVARSPQRSSLRQDPPLVRALLIATAVGVIGVLIVIPVVSVFHQAFAEGPGAYWKCLIHDRDSRHAIGLTLVVAPFAVAINLLFGLAAAWAISRFRFPGRALLTALVDLPFAVSPVAAGLGLMLIFGLQGFLGPWLQAHQIKVIFAVPGLVLATTFVTVPFVARELIPVLEALGPDEELAAVSLGANGRQILSRVLLPNLRWGLLYGMTLSSARAMGEFGAVYVVSGRISGQTDTMPLRVEKLFQDYRMPEAFALASVLMSLALATLVLKTWLERKSRLALAEALAPRITEGNA